MKNDILNGIKNIVFDFGCVLVDLDRHKCIEALNAIGAHKISCYVDECKQADMFLDLELGKISVEEFCDEIRRRAPGCEASNEEIRYAWGELLQQIPVRRMRAVERLHKTHKVYMLSNSNSVHWDKAVEHFFPLSGHGPEYYFDKTFISYNMGMVKPDPRIFETLLQETGAVAEETLFVDDSLANCKAAEAFGIRTLHVTHGDEWLDILSPDDENSVGRESVTNHCHGAGSVATIGFFDGVHRGHRYLIDQVKEVAERHGLQSVVVTFDKHPREVLHSDYMPQMLSTLDEKVARIRATGVDRCEVLPFNEETASLSAFDFMRMVLKDRLGVEYLVIGYDNRFGHNRSEGFDDYVAFGKQIGIEVIRAKVLVLNEVNVSSSVIRTFLSGGEVDLAAKCLGYRYALRGKVVGGVKEGRRMGFPTANIAPSSVRTMIPAPGVYVMTANVGDGKERPAMMNIGCRPTFDGETTTLEVHIIGYEGDLYGSEISVNFVKRLRSERKFASEQELMRQLQSDRQQVLDLLG